MGRKKIDIVKINEPKKRQVTFNKRSKGVAVKLLELHNLCGAQIFSIIMSDTGKMTVVNAGGSPSDLINKYNSLKNNKKIFREFTELDQLKVNIPITGGVVDSEPKQEDEKGDSTNTIAYLSPDSGLLNVQDSTDYMGLYFNEENKKLILENEENESLNCKDDFLVEKLI